MLRDIRGRFGRHKLGVCGVAGSLSYVVFMAALFSAMGDTLRPAMTAQAGFFRLRFSPPLAGRCQKRALEASQALFTYLNAKPGDTRLVRSLPEFETSSFVVIIMFVGMAIVNDGCFASAMLWVLQFGETDWHRHHGLQQL